MSISFKFLLLLMVACNFSGKKEEGDDSAAKNTKSTDNAADGDSRSISQKANVYPSENRAVVEGSIKLTDFFENEESLGLTSSVNCSDLSISIILKPVNGEVTSKCNDDALDYKLIIEYNQFYALEMQVSNSNTSVSGALTIPPLSPQFTGAETFALKIPSDVEVEAIAPNVDAAALIYCCLHEWPGLFGGVQSDHHHDSVANFQKAINACDTHKFGGIGHTCSCGKTSTTDTNTTGTIPSTEPTIQPMETFTPVSFPTVAVPVETFTPVSVPTGMPTMLPTNTYPTPGPQPSISSTTIPLGDHSHDSSTSAAGSDCCYMRDWDDESPGNQPGPITHCVSASEYIGLGYTCTVGTCSGPAGATSTSMPSP